MFGHGKRVRLLPRTGPLCITALGWLWGVAGCAVHNTDMIHFLRAHDNKVSAIEYRIGIPDVIGINAPRILEIDGEGQQIQPDGKINLDLLGEVKIVDMTAKEVAAKLEVLLGRYYTDPKVSVRVLSYASKKFYVHGQGGSGPQPYTGHDTLVDAVLASGADFRAWTSRVKVIRPSDGTNPPRTITINVDRMVKKGEWEKNLMLEPNDVVYIPPTPFAWVGQQIRALLSPVSPVLQAYTTPLEFRYAQTEYRFQNDNGNNTRGRRGRSSRGRRF